MILLYDITRCCAIGLLALYDVPGYTITTTERKGWNLRNEHAGWLLA